MTSDDLTPEQAAALQRRVARTLRWLGKLQTRMEKLRFPPGDPLYVAARRARDDVQDLHTACHYASCTHGVGRTERRADG